MSEKLSPRFYRRNEARAMVKWLTDAQRELRERNYGSAARLIDAALDRMELRLSVLGAGCAYCDQGLEIVHFDAGTFHYRDRVPLNSKHAHLVPCEAR